MFASSSTLRPATVGQGLLCVVVGTGMSVPADLKIGGSSPPPARIEIHRAIAHGGNSPDGMLWLLAVPAIIVVGAFRRRAALCAADRLDPTATWLTRASHIDALLPG
jgi:hypothetical protein